MKTFNKANLVGFVAGATFTVWASLHDLPAWRYLAQMAIHLVTALLVWAGLEWRSERQAAKKSAT